MVDVKTIHFTVSREVDTGLPLDIKDNARGVEAGLLAGISDKPVRGRIGSDGGSQYFGLIVHISLFVSPRGPWIHYEPPQNNLDNSPSANRCQDIFHSPLLAPHLRR